MLLGCTSEDSELGDLLPKSSGSELVIEVLCEVLPTRHKSSGTSWTISCYSCGVNTSRSGLSPQARGAIPLRKQVTGLEIEV
jgi:hypothetical protein